MFIGGKSVLDCDEDDFRKAGFLSRRNVALNGNPLGDTCLLPHQLDLAVEGGKIFVCCEVCHWAEFLHERDDPHDRYRKPKTHYHQGLRPL